MTATLHAWRHRAVALGAALATTMLLTPSLTPPALAGPATVALHGSTATASEPESWQSTCSSAALGLDDVQVDLAPVLTGPKGDRAPGGGDIAVTPDARGRWVPVVLVHGWTSSATHNPDRTGTFSHTIDLTANRMGPASGDRSLVGQLQGIPGAAVFTYDYHDYSARWVDDNHLGPGLGKVIDCLYQASGKQKVILVGHSMGGLISRYAASHQGVTGKNRAGEISTAVTFGTPETGSLAAQIAALAADPQGALAGLTGIQAELLPAQATVLGSVLSACGQLSSDQLQTGTLCDALPPPVRTFSSDAGVALRYGSKKLRQLDDWPRGIVVDAVAGDTEFTVPKIGWFAKPWDTDRVPMGDMIVTTGSALARADLTRDTTCAYQLSAFRGATDQVGLALGLTAKPDVAQQPLGSFSGPCFHTSLMRGRELTNEAMGAVADDIASRQPVTEADLLSAPVPEACGHEAGTLKDGIQPGIPTNLGVMGLAWRIWEGDAKEDSLQFGDFTGDGLDDAAVVLNCDMGGVGWPRIIAFYARTGSAAEPVGIRLLAWGFTTEIVEDSYRGENGFVLSMKKVAGGVRASWLTQQEGDGGCCGTLVVTATLAPKSGQVRATDVVRTTEQETAAKFFSALASGDQAASVEASNAELASQAQADIQSYPTLADAAKAPPTCAVDVYLPPSVRAAFSQLYDDTTTFNRVCYIQGADGLYAAVGMHMEPIGVWHAVRWSVLPP